jgi:hypothetical protein
MQKPEQQLKHDDRKPQPRGIRLKTRVRAGGNDLGPDNVGKH